MRMSTRAHTQQRAHTDSTRTHLFCRWSRPDQIPVNLTKLKSHPSSQTIKSANMSAATNRIVQLQTEAELANKTQQLLENQIREQDDVIAKQRETIQSQSTELIKARKQVTELADNDKTNTELIKQQRFVIDAQKEELDSLKKELEEAKQRILELNSGTLTPPPTPESRPKRKRARFNPEPTQRNIKIFELKLRSNNRNMFRAAFGDEEEVREYHVEDIAQHYPEQTKEFLASKKNFRRGKQIESIRARGIMCLVDILDELDEDLHMVE